MRFPARCRSGLRRWDRGCTLGFASETRQLLKTISGLGKGVLLSPVRLPTRQPLRQKPEQASCVTKCVARQAARSNGLEHNQLRVRYSMLVRGPRSSHRNDAAQTHSDALHVSCTKGAYCESCTTLRTRICAAEGIRKSGQKK